MMVSILRLLGVAPDQPGKTGKREAAWAFTFIPLFLTLLPVLTAVFVFAAGGDIAPMIDLVSGMREVLVWLWTAAAGFLGTAYGLDWRAKQSPRKREPDPPEDPLGGIAVPDGAVG